MFMRGNDIIIKDSGYISSLHVISEYSWSCVNGSVTTHPVLTCLAQHLNIHNVL